MKVFRTTKNTVSGAWLTLALAECVLAGGPPAAPSPRDESEAPSALAAELGDDPFTDDGPGGPPPSPMDRALMLEPIANLTTIAHQAPSAFRVPRGTILRLRQRCLAGDRVYWHGAIEVEKHAASSIAECAMEQPGHWLIIARVSNGNDNWTRRCEVEVVDADVQQLRARDVKLDLERLPLDDSASNMETMEYYFGPSIAAVTSPASQEATDKAAAPRSLRRRFVTSVNRPVSFITQTDPPGFEDLMEVGVDGTAMSLATSGPMSFEAVGRHHVTIGPPGRTQTLIVDTYEVRITSHVHGQDMIPEGESITFEAVTNPPGFEEQITWLSSTKFGRARPVTVRGPVFTVRFDDVWGRTDGGAPWQWLGVKADNLFFNQDGLGCDGPEDCIDDNACTDDNCILPEGKCQNPLNYDPAQSCCNPVTGALQTINDGNPCTADSCSAGTGQVSHTPTPGAHCELPDPCLTGAFCDATAACVGGALEHPPGEGCETHVPGGKAITHAAPCGDECNECQDPDDDPFDPVYLFSGEFYESAVDLRIPGRGLDFIWSRTYRSRAGLATQQGKGWDFSYNIQLFSRSTQLRDARQNAGAEDAFVVCSGNNREDVFAPQLAGTWSRNEFFQELSQTASAAGTTTHTLTFADTGAWEFEEVASQTASAPPLVVRKIKRITDRNGNALQLFYDLNGLLTSIQDTLGRNILIGYSAGRLTSVTDFAGRIVTYEYYDGIEPGGNLGDLKSATTPQVGNNANFPIPPGHDFSGKTTTYTYTTGFADQRLNSNLLTITDPKGQTYLQNVYAHTISAADFRHTTNPSNLYFDRIVRQIWGDSGDIIDFVYIAQTPGPANNNAVIKVIVNDRMGNVLEYFFNSRNQRVMLREYTGRAPDPNAPTTESLNRPTGKLRAADPDYFETRWEYNKNSQVTRVVQPNGDEQQHTYDTTNPSPRSRGNMLQQCRLPGVLGGAQAQICESFEYDDGFGGCCGTNFVTQTVDARANQTLHQYDANGNRTQTTHRIPSIVEDWTYNGFGQMASHTLPDNGSAHRRVDQYTYYPSGTMKGYLHEVIMDATNLALTTAHEYDLVGNRVKTTDPRGHDTQFVYNQLNQILQEISREVTDGSGVRYETDKYYDANDNVVRVDVQNVDDQGVVGANTHFSTIVEYEILNNRTRVCLEKGTANLANAVRDCAAIPAGDLDEFVVTEYEYDENRNRTLARSGEAANGNDPFNIVRTEFDERNLPFRAARAYGHPTDVSTTQHDYDKNRNLVKESEGMESSPRITTHVYDGYNRRTTSTDAMGNVNRRTYDANSNQLSDRTEGQRTDVVGGAGNVRLSHANYFYDAMDRLFQSDVQFFDTQTQAPIGGGISRTLTAYSRNSQVTQSLDPRVNLTTFTYDTANRVSVITDALNNTISHGYDENSNIVTVTEVERHDPSPTETYVTTYAYDNLDRRIEMVDNVGNTNVFGYDSRGDQTVTLDALSRETRNQYDGLSRLTATVRDLDDDGADGDGPDITTSQAWDDSSRLVSQSDDNGNATTYLYDSLNRMIGLDYADCTQNAYAYDVHDNRITSLDANGSLVTNTYDLRNRVSNRSIDRASTGEGDPVDVLGTTFETISYDGLSRVVRAQDDDSVVVREFDSLSSVISETINGVPTTAIYDLMGNQTSCTYPGGRRIDTTYDALNRKKVITDRTQVMSPVELAEYFYVGPSRVERREYGNATTTEYEYDGLTPSATDFGVRQIVRTHHFVTANPLTTIDDRTFAWDKMGNKTQRKDIRTTGPQFTHDYTYDDTYRLTHTEVNDPTPPTIRSTDYTLDGVGNRSQVTGSPDPGMYTRNATTCEPADDQMNQYTTTSFDTRTYDPNGNLTVIEIGMPEERLITYDYRNQMIEYEVTVTGERHTYAYDALGRRIAKVVDADGVMGGSVTTLFFYDGWREIEEQDDLGATLATYVFGLYIDEVLSMQRDVIPGGGPENYYYHADDLYNVMVVTDASAAVVERYEYLDYGQPADPLTDSPIPNFQSQISNPLLFTGRRYDSETAFYYYRTRHLDPSSGRFTTRDTLGIWGDLANGGNPYAYLADRAATHVDPFGLSKGKVLKELLKFLAGWIASEVIEEAIEGCNIGATRRATRVSDCYCLHCHHGEWHRHYGKRTCTGMEECVTDGKGGGIWRSQNGTWKCGWCIAMGVSCQ